jgi:hypothetical protein
LEKKRFKVICTYDGSTSFYDTRVKTWFGWIPFTVFYKTDILHLLTDPSDQKSLAYERIYQYCQEKGYKKKDIIITESDGNKKRMFCCFKKIFSPDKKLQN